MIAFVNGTIESIFANQVFIDCNGVGYRVIVAPSAISRLTLNEKAKLYTYTSVKEDGITLYGFLTIDDWEMFHMLISVSGVGPKVAQGMLSVSNPSQLLLYIATEDADMLSKAPGVGKKLAQRIAMELKDKVKKASSFESSVFNPQQNLEKMSDGVRPDAIDALLTLGYSRSEAVSAVMEIDADGLSVETLVKLALKKMISKR